MHPDGAMAARPTAAFLCGKSPPLCTGSGCAGCGRACIPPMCRLLRRRQPPPLLSVTDKATGVHLEVRRLPGKGAGVVTAKTIKQGTRIWSEVPLLVVAGAEQEPHLEAARLFKETGAVPEALEALLKSRLDALPQQTQEDFWALHDPYSESLGCKMSACGILSANGMDLTEASIFQGDQEAPPSLSDCGVLAIGSRFNHSCTPNVHFAWSTERGSMAFHALRDVARGEELCICYDVDLLVLPGLTRQEILKKWQFRCKCATCCLKGGEQMTSDLRRVEMLSRACSLGLKGGAPPEQEDPDQNRRFQEEVKLTREEIEKDPLEGLPIVMQLSVLVDEELKGHPPSQRVAYARGSELAMKGGNKELAVELAWAAHKQSCIADADSQMTRQLEERAKLFENS